MDRLVLVCWVAGKRVLAGGTAAEGSPVQGELAAARPTEGLET